MPSVPRRSSPTWRFSASSSEPATPDSCIVRVLDGVCCRCGGRPVGSPGHAHSGRGRAARKPDYLSLELWRTRPASTNALSHIIDQMFEQTFVPFGSGSRADGGGSAFKSVPVNVWETEDSYYVSVLAPGLDAKNVDVRFHDDTLAIEGTLAFHTSEGAKVVWQEFDPGPTPFRRSLPLGAFVDTSQVEAVYRDGLLVLTMPKAEHARPRQIHVKATSLTKSSPPRQGVEEVTTSVSGRTAALTRDYRYVFNDPDAARKV